MFYIAGFPKFFGLVQEKGWLQLRGGNNLLCIFNDIINFK